ncbi:hypothetical protein D9M71_829790 [compost metagenome]
MQPVFAADARQLDVAERGAQVVQKLAVTPENAGLELHKSTYSLLMKCLISLYEQDRGSQVKTVRKRSLSWRSW